MMRKIPFPLRLACPPRTLLPSFRGEISVPLTCFPYNGAHVNVCTRLEIGNGLELLDGERARVMVWCCHVR